MCLSGERCDQNDLLFGFIIHFFLSSVSFIYIILNKYKLLEYYWYYVYVFCRLQQYIDRKHNDIPEYTEISENQSLPRETYKFPGSEFRRSTG